jgi:hypothetical protein
MKMYTEFVTFENSNAFAQRRAKRWWQTRSRDSNLLIPTTVNEALARIQEINHPTHIRVWVNKSPYPEIMALCFDGTAFGTEEMSDEVPTVVTALAKDPKHFEEVDIPF